VKDLVAPSLPDILFKFNMKAMLIILSVGSATWFDQGKPWAVFTLEEVKYNVDVSEYILQKGP